MSDIRSKERSKKSKKTHKNPRFVHILIKNYKKQHLIVIFSFADCFISFVCLICVNDLPPGGVGEGGPIHTYIPTYTLYIHMFLTLVGGGAVREGANFKKSKPL